MSYGECILLIMQVADIDQKQPDLSSYRDEFREGVGLAGIKLVCNPPTHCIRR